MKTLYMHIGTPKTGTTAIQTFLFDNSAVLAEKGYCFRRMPFSFRGVAKNRNANFLIQSFDTSDGRHSPGEVWARGTQELLGWFREFDNVIISDEGLWRSIAGKNSTILPNLKAWTDEHDIEIKIIVYLRRQDEFVTSHWLQRIKTGSVTDSFQDYCKRKDVILQNSYYKNLTKMADIVGKENLIVHKFDRKNFSGGNILGDFLNALGLELTDDFSMEQEFKNLSTTNDYTEILRLLNSLSDEAGTVYTKENRYFSDMALRLSERDGENSTLFDEAGARKFFEKFLPQNQKVAKEYFHEDGNLFEFKWKELPAWSSDSPHYLESVIKYFGLALYEQNVKIEQFRKEKEAFETYIRDLPLWADHDNNEQDIVKYFGQAFAEQKIRIDRLEKEKADLEERVKQEKRKLQTEKERLEKLEKTVSRLSEQLEAEKRQGFLRRNLKKSF